MSHIVNFNGWNCKVVLGQYRNGRTAIELEDVDTGEPIAVSTVNVPSEELEEDEVLIKDWSENEGMLHMLQEARIIGPVVDEVPTGHVLAHKCKLLIQ